MQYVGFWACVGAALIDGIVIAVGVSVTAMILGAVLANIGLAELAGHIGGIYGFLASIAYEVWFVSSKHMATPGKMAIGAIVAKPDGSRLTVMNALGRYLGKQLSGVLFRIGYIIVAFTEKKQGLHDMLAETVVIKKTPAAGGAIA